MSDYELRIEPPLLNSASPWATTLEDLASLYNCPYTGAITVRTSLVEGFNHDPAIHQYAFFSPITQYIATDALRSSSSLNTLGYSPTSLSKYLNMLSSAAAGEIPNFRPRPSKPIILSVTGTADEVAKCYLMISSLQSDFAYSLRLMMEINLSCPNIPDKPPPAYNEDSLMMYLVALVKVLRIINLDVKNVDGRGAVLVGIKTPPYTYQGQYNGLISALKTSATMEGGCPISFITATNTLGSCLVLSDLGKEGEFAPAIHSANNSGIGGMAGAALHPLALGNVATIRKMLQIDDELKHIKIIGVGGVDDGNGFDRMITVGADVVGLATALGREGLKVFEKIYKGMSKET